MPPNGEHLYGEYVLNQHVSTPTLEYDRPFHAKLHKQVQVKSFECHHYEPHLQVSTQQLPLYPLPHDTLLHDYYAVPSPLLTSSFTFDDDNPRHTHPQCLTPILPKDRDNWGVTAHINAMFKSNIRRDTMDYNLVSHKQPIYTTYGESTMHIHTANLDRPLPTTTSLQMGRDWMATAIDSNTIESINPNNPLYEDGELNPHVESYAPWTPRYFQIQCTWLASSDPERILGIGFIRSPYAYPCRMKGSEKRFDPFERVAPLLEASYRTG